MKEELIKMSWKEIIEKYPDEWVLLDDHEPDIDFDGVGVLASKGRVLVHAKTEKEFHEKAIKIKRTPETSTAKLWTGDLAPKGQSILWEKANQ